MRARFALLQFLLLAVLALVATPVMAKPFSKDVCDAAFPTPSTLRKSFSVNRAKHTPEFKALDRVEASEGENASGHPAAAVRIG